MFIGKKRYRAITKVLCPACQKRLDPDCRDCQWLKYNNVNRLVKFTKYLDENHPTWIFFTVYEYVKNHNGQKLGMYTNGKNRRVPVRDHEL